MITIEMLTAAVYSFLGLGALVVAVTQLFKNWSADKKWYIIPKADGKKWPDHLLSFIASLICCGAVLGAGLYFNIGIFAAFCVSCFSSWLMFAGTVIGCTGVSNGAWSYEFMQKILEWIKLLPTQTTKSVAQDYEKEAQKLLDEAKSNANN